MDFVATVQADLATAFPGGDASHIISAVKVSNMLSGDFHAQGKTLPTVTSERSLKLVVRPSR